MAVSGRGKPLAHAATAKMTERIESSTKDRCPPRANWRRLWRGPAPRAGAACRLTDSAWVIKMSRNYDGELWESRSNGSRRVSNRPQRRPRIWERGRLAQKTGSAGVPPAETKAGKMPALHSAIGLNAARESGSAGVPPEKQGARASRPHKNKSGQDARAPQSNRPQRRPRIWERGRPTRKTGSAGVPPAETKAGKMPALHRASVSPAVHERGEKPRERGLRFARGSKPRPGVKRRAEDRLRRPRPVNGPPPSTFFRGCFFTASGGHGDKARGRAFAKERGLPSQENGRTRGQPRQSPRVSRKTMTDRKQH